MPTYAPVWQIFPTPLGSQKHRSSFSEAIPGSSERCATQVRASTSTQGPASTDPSPEGHGFMTSCATCKAQPAEVDTSASKRSHKRAFATLRSQLTNRVIKT